MEKPLEQSKIKPILKKQDSKQSYFVGSLRKDLHPIVLNEKTKKRKMSALRQIIKNHE